MDRQTALFEYLLRLGDSYVVLSHRLGELCGHGPYLEEDIAQTNIALDLLGQARNLLTYAGEVEGRGRSEDDLAYHRDDRGYRNFLLVEQPNEDYAHVIARQFLFDAFNLELLERLTRSSDETVAGIAQKAIKESAYHVQQSGDWVVRLGDGTQESHERMAEALDWMWPYTGELFMADAVDRKVAAAGIAPDPEELKAAWDRRVDAVLAEAGLERPADVPWQTGGKTGYHTEYLGYLLAEMQILPRTHPGAEW
jgi:ring-1,2-phenylacetyl-CoA epoxidase subunit PaaC